MKPGDRIQIYPAGQPGKAAPARVVLCGNGKALAASFDDAPGFVVAGGGVAYHPEHGLMFIARQLDDGTWQELFAGGRFEVRSQPCRD